MDPKSMMRLEQFRRTEAGPLEETLIDDFVGGEMDRSTFIRRASVLGLSMSMIGAALEAFGHVGIDKAAPAVASVQP